MRGVGGVQRILCTLLFYFELCETCKALYVDAALNLNNPKLKLLVLSDKIMSLNQNLDQESSTFNTKRNDFSLNKTTKDNFIKANFVLSKKL